MTRQGETGDDERSEEAQGATSRDAQATGNDRDPSSGTAPRSADHVHAEAASDEDRRRSVSVITETSDGAGRYAQILASMVMRCRATLRFGLAYVLEQLLRMRARGWSGIGQVHGRDLVERYLVEVECGEDGVGGHVFLDAAAAGGRAELAMALRWLLGKGSIRESGSRGTAETVRDGETGVGEAQVVRAGHGDTRANQTGVELNPSGRVAVPMLRRAQVLSSLVLRVREERRHALADALECMIREAVIGRLFATDTQCELVEQYLAEVDAIPGGSVELAGALRWALGVGASREGGSRGDRAKTIDADPARLGKDSTRESGSRETWADRDGESGNPENEHGIGTTSGSRVVHGNELVVSHDRLEVVESLMAHMYKIGRLLVLCIDEDRLEFARALSVVMARFTNGDPAGAARYFVAEYVDAADSGRRDISDDDAFVGGGLVHSLRWLLSELNPREQIAEVTQSEPGIREIALDESWLAETARRCADDDDAQVARAGRESGPMAVADLDPSPMKNEYDFSSGSRGRFYRPGASVRLPIDGSTRRSGPRENEEARRATDETGVRLAEAVVVAQRFVGAGDAAALQPWHREVIAETIGIFDARELRGVDIGARARADRRNLVALLAALDGKLGPRERGAVKTNIVNPTLRGDTRSAIPAPNWSPIVSGADRVIGYVNLTRGARVLCGSLEELSPREQSVGTKRSDSENDVSARESMSRDSTQDRTTDGLVNHADRLIAEIAKLDEVNRRYAESLIYAVRHLQDTACDFCDLGLTWRDGCLIIEFFFDYRRVVFFLDRDAKDSLWFIASSPPSSVDGSGVLGVVSDYLPAVPLAVLDRALSDRRSSSARESRSRDLSTLSTPVARGIVSDDDRAEVDNFLVSMPHNAVSSAIRSAFAIVDGRLSEQDRDALERWISDISSANLGSQVERLVRIMRSLLADVDSRLVSRVPDPNSRGHLVGGQFQSDKYPTTPPGKVPLSVRDVSAQDLLWEYAQRRRVVDDGFSEDLERALRLAGYSPGSHSSTGLEGDAKPKD